MKIISFFLLAATFIAVTAFNMPDDKEFITANLPHDVPDTKIKKPSA